MDMVQHLAQMSRIQEENDTYKCQLEAYKNEIEILKKESDNSGETKVNYIWYCLGNTRTIAEFNIELYKPFENSCGLSR